MNTQLTTPKGARRNGTRPHWRIPLWGLVAMLALSLVLGMRGSIPAVAQPAALQATVKQLQALTISYTYDSAGRLVTANYGLSTLHYAYDETGNLAYTEPWSTIYLPVLLRDS